MLGSQHSLETGGRELDLGRRTQRSENRFLKDLGARVSRMPPFTFVDPQGSLISLLQAASLFSGPPQPTGVIPGLHPVSATCARHQFITTYLSIQVFLLCYVRGCMRAGSPHTAPHRNHARADARTDGKWVDRLTSTLMMATAMTKIELGGWSKARWAPERSQ